MQPGQHLVVINGDPVFYRAQGLELRDTLAALVPGSMIPVYLFRVPLDGTVAGTLLGHGYGGLNIDGCRVSGAQPSVPHPVFRSKALPGSGHTYNTHAGVGRNGTLSQATGRWPPNLLIVHGPGCRRVGEKRVRAEVNAQSPAGKVHVPGWGLSGKVPAYHYGDGDGLETVPAWDCQPGCPALVLDAQSGLLKSAMGNPGKQTNNDALICFNGRAVSDPGRNQWGDSGGASRFFPQFASLSEALDWLLRLVG